LLPPIAVVSPLPPIWKAQKAGLLIKQQQHVAWLLLLLLIQTFLLHQYAVVVANPKISSSTNLSVLVLLLLIQTLLLHQFAPPP
jgi:hypothetical protein